jgi:hypothetical protein
VKPCGACKGVPGEIPVPGAVSGVPGLSLCRVGWVVLAQGVRARGRRGLCGSGAESARLAELHWLSLLLKAVGSAGDLRLSLAGSRGPARVTGSIVAAAGAGA